MAGIVAVHSGAGNVIDETKYQRVIKEACIRATDVLKNGGSAMDACEAAIIRLENCGNTNAGFGSNLCFDGHVQCDASIMNGATLHYGACTNVSTLKNPIQFARRLCDGQAQLLPMDRIPPMIMAGIGAECYAEELGCTIVDPSALISSKARFMYDHYKSQVNLHKEKAEDSSKNPEAITITTSPPNNESNVSLSDVSALDTVGAVVVDGSGNSVAACSSGGILLKIPGRVGQAATYGAGCWATDTKDKCVATSTTGNGEYLMKTLLAREISMELITSHCPVTALNNTFKMKFLRSPFLDQTQELYAGALTLLYDRQDCCGELLWSHTTRSLCVGYMTTQQKQPKFIHSLLPTYCCPGRATVVNGQKFQLHF